MLRPEACAIYPMTTRSGATTPLAFEPGAEPDPSFASNDPTPRQVQQHERAEKIQFRICR